MPILPAVWSRLAHEVHALLLEAAGMERVRVGLTGLQEQRLQPLCSGVPWNAVMAREVMLIVGPRPRASDGVSHAPGARRGLLLVSALRMAHAVLTERHGAFRDPMERAIARRACQRAMGHLSPASDAARIVCALATTPPSLLPAIPGDASVASGGTGALDLVQVPFRYLWARPVSGSSVTTESTATQGVSVIDAADAPVACMLRFLDGREIGLRLHEGTCIRPVLSPQAGMPIGIRAFREAARVAPAWRDAPWNGAGWVDRDGRDEAPVNPCLPLAEVAEPAHLRDAAESARDAGLSDVRARVSSGSV